LNEYEYDDDGGDDDDDEGQSPESKAPRASIWMMAMMKPLRNRPQRKPCEAEQDVQPGTYGLSP
jgi:hypothetical protein